MNALARIVCALALAGCATGCSIGDWLRGDAEPELVVKDGAAQREFRFTYVANVPKAPAGAKQLDVWLPVPSSTAAQRVTIEDIAAPVPYAIATDPETGTRMIHLRFEGDALRETSIAVKSRVRSIERKRDDERSAFMDAPTPRDLAPDALAPWDAGPAAMAEKAAGGTTDRLEAGEKMYRAVLDHMRYSKDGTGWGRGDVTHACTAGFGNCTDFHSLFIAMARSRGIPARFIMGFPLPETRGAGEVKGYHCWAEFFVDGVGWVPVDASEADKHPELANYYFGSLTADRVAFTRGRDLVLVPPQQGPPLNFFIYPYAELDGKPFDGLTRTFHYEDL